MERIASGAMVQAHVYDYPHIVPKLEAYLEAAIER